MKKVAIITARGGSKRIPRKNVKEFCGKPIIAHSIENALTAGLFDEVMVSTDDPEIAKVAEAFGATVPFFRSEKNADDFATTLDVLFEVINQYKSLNRHFDFGCCIYPTAPFADAELLNKGFNLLQDKKYDTVFPVIEYSTPIQRALAVNDAGQIEMINSAHEGTRSQDLKKAYYDAGQFYWFDVEKLFANKKIYSKNTGAVVISEMEAQDIDNITDWKLAEIKYSMKQKNSTFSQKP